MPEVPRALVNLLFEGIWSLQFRPPPPPPGALTEALAKIKARYVASEESQMSTPNRWLHLRHSDGFDDPMFAMFSAQCEVWKAYVRAVTEHWGILEAHYSATYRPPAYEFFSPERSTDRGVVTLPVGGYQTLGSRATFENAASRLLSEFFPLQFKLRLEEGLTETINPARGAETFWRPLLRREDGTPVF